MHSMLILLVVARFVLDLGHQNNPEPTANAPQVAIRLFRTTGLDRQYEFSEHLKPSYLSGDFDGDRKPDIAILVRQKTNR